MFRCSDLPNRSARPSAIQAYRESTIVSGNSLSAPKGAYHWWDIGADGHVAMSIGGGWALMASSHVTESWGRAIGITSIANYNQITRARYLGWSYDYVGSEIRDVRSNGGGGGGGGNGIPQTTTANDGIPGHIYWQRMQLFAQKNGYTGPVDGSMGKNSWIGVQRGLRPFGYTGPIDGVPGSNCYKAMQRVAQRFGYTGPIDGAMGPRSYMGFARFLNTL